MKKLGILIALCGISLFNIAIVNAEVIEEKAVTNNIVKVVRDIDNIIINPNTKTIIIRTVKKYLDADGNVVKQERGKTIRFIDKKDNPETPNINEAKTDYTSFIQELGLNKIKIIKAIKARISKK